MDTQKPDATQIYACETAQRRKNLTNKSEIKLKTLETAKNVQKRHADNLRMCNRPSSFHPHLNKEGV